MNAPVVQLRLVETAASGVEYEATRSGETLTISKHRACRLTLELAVEDWPTVRALLDDLEHAGRS